MASEIIETWEINNRINLYLLDAVPEDALADRAGDRGRNVGEQFAHLHNVRLMWLKSGAPDLAERIASFARFMYWEARPTSKFEFAICR